LSCDAESIDESVFICESVEHAPERRFHRRSSIAEVVLGAPFHFHHDSDNDDDDDDCISLCRIDRHVIQIS
jgi:hypothetical protein